VSALKFHPWNISYSPSYCRLLLISTYLCIPDVATFQSHSIKTFTTYVPAFTTSSHLHATLLFYPGSEQSCLSDAQAPVLKMSLFHYIRSKPLPKSTHLTQDSTLPHTLFIFFFALYIIVLICYSITLFCIYLFDCCWWQVWSKRYCHCHGPKAIDFSFPFARQDHKA